MFGTMIVKKDAEICRSEPNIPKSVLFLSLSYVLHKSTNHNVSVFKKILKL